MKVKLNIFTVLKLALKGKTIWSKLKKEKIKWPTKGNLVTAVVGAVLGAGMVTPESAVRIESALQDVVGLVQSIL